MMEKTKRSESTSEVPALQTTGTVYELINPDTSAPLYDIRSSFAFVTKSLPAFTLKTSCYNPRRSRSPGPNEYNVSQSRKINSGYIESKGYTYLEELCRSTSAVGPGQYEVKDQRNFGQSKIKGGNISSRQKAEKPSGTPPPNEYNPVVSKKEKSTHMFVDDREPFRPSKDEMINPGPAKYTVKTDEVLEKEESISFPTMIVVDKANTNPGSGEYNVSTKYTQEETPAFSIKNRNAGECHLI